jgi:peptide/nickel transport system permease protein
MLAYTLRRSIIAVGTIWAISLIVFVIIEIPPGDAITTQLTQLGYESGFVVTDEEIANLKSLYALDRPLLVRYVNWLKRLAVGQYGVSYTASGSAGHGDSIPVRDVVFDKLMMTIAVALAAMVLTWLMVLPIGIYSAVRQYSIGDYSFTFFGFLGLATPDFLLALVLMYVGFRYVGADIGGLFSFEYVQAPWSIARVWDLIKHLWLPAVVLGTSGTAAGIRILRANLLDEIRKPYVLTARTRGLPEARLLLKYPLRVALNPAISTIGYLLPALVGGSVIVSVVLDLPTLGPVLLDALLGQDTQLAAIVLLLIGALTVVGTLISDLLLAWIDPRIRKGFEG